MMHQGNDREEGCLNGHVQQAVPLSELRSGQRATLDRADLHCDECDLLNAMGLTHECELRVCRRGEPCIVQINSTRLGLSSKLAGRIFVRPQALPR